MFPLTVTAAEVRRRGKRLVGPVDLNLDGTGVTIVIGPNGSGKTSLLRMLHGLARLSAGRIDWACPTDEARKGQAFVFQTPLILRRSVRDNLAYPLQVAGTDRRTARDRADLWGQRVGLGAALDNAAHGLSAGERQKLALARALIAEPALLFLDEPCAALDGAATREIEAILHDSAAAGTRILMSTHDMGQARRLANDVLFLLRGRIHDSGPAPAFFEGPSTDQAAAFLRGDIVE
jgi:tungstate transport system ATP-binding protein